jgi:hypothetical protein
VICVVALPIISMLEMNDLFDFISCLLGTTLGTNENRKLTLGLDLSAFSEFRAMNAATTFFSSRFAVGKKVLVRCSFISACLRRWGFWSMSSRIVASAGPSGFHSPPPIGVVSISGLALIPVV